MNPNLFAITCLIPAAYFVGAIPVGLLLAAMKGIHIRQVGSGNIGATNVYRCVGKRWGIATFILDALKGFLPAFLFPLIPPDPPAWLGLACGIAAVAGHNWPIWLGFRGGKGVSTSAGMLLGVAPAAAGIGLGIFVVTLALTRIVSVGSISAAVAVSIAGWFLYHPNNPILSIALLIMGLMVIWRHRSNVRRLWNGTEPRIASKKK